MPHPPPPVPTIKTPKAADPITEIEVQWHSKSGITYQLRYTENLGTSWTILPTVYQGDGTLKSVVFPVSEGPRRFFTLIEHAPVGFNPIVAWDGSYVLLERFPLEPGNKHRLYRDGQLIADIQSDTLSFKDSGVSSGARPVYTAEAYGS